MTTRLLPVSRTSTTFDWPQPRPSEQKVKVVPAQWEVVDVVPLAPVAPVNTSVDCLLNQWRVERCEQARDDYLRSLKEL